jgi:hypothetical protein
VSTQVALIASAGQLCVAPKWSSLTTTPVSGMLPVFLAVTV